MRIRLLPAIERGKVILKYSFVIKSILKMYYGLTKLECDWNVCEHDDAKTKYTDEI